MRNYDLTLIFSPSLSEQEANDQFQRLVSFVQEQGGILEDQRMLGKKPLLSPIRGSKEGYLALIAFSLSEDKLPTLEKECRGGEQILRFSLARQMKKAKKAQAAPAPVPASLPTSEVKKEEKIDLADIDEKLEEIFKE
ncbi:MAG: hypothetical protein A3J30_00895 [Candidatus Wildermuthbacteria bacterium RIFCSPLOWO2_02_FULL_47_9c]|uniref:Small ribosomal subunit protein bS6 n=2 Tax=Parcubacteria group TaxID=1794811 RepID=A0A837IS37_9BACT|nr:MAG: 30S ribosomal protein S6 [Candidatus Yanofskybacteria bacterium GW2011_GWC1_48_11]KKW03394.1 MAG: 30S ribosomal protein S6 [Parcubacteria group bacterium GW2011_GWB1_49_12]KKW08324.1 MAG: 30S ribosomal protein S6 [Parcubacteria group bacterium GW2011_GWA1_49_26]KKW13791.1 MAG: 30S ribosomal protein S6 [Parcubacteria group bacterium GW2011_GWA2_50_10]OHA61905.1 MAG: hypothetical protein A2109_03060 [Candidatus Wildermuthbacteria bacterium GWA1_49_26]OHA66374.1 MAG: hypothetical protein 